MALVDGTVVACMVDAFMVIVAERIRFNISAVPKDHQQHSTSQKNLIDLILSGEVTKNQLQEFGQKDVNDLWLANISILARADIFQEKVLCGSNPSDRTENDVSNEVSNLPQHFSRLLGAYFSTFEVLATSCIDSATEEEERDFYKYVVEVSKFTLFPFTCKSNCDSIIYLFREYRNLFSFCYMFNRRTAVYPESISSELTQYIKSTYFETDNATTANSNSFDGEESAIFENLLSSKLDAPIVSPFKTYDSNTGKSTISNSNQNLSVKSDWLETSDEVSLALSPMSAAEPPLPIVNMVSQEVTTQSIVDDDDIDDGMSVSITENSILDSYYNNDYKLWNMDPSNVPVEEDEDSDREQVYTDTVNQSSDRSISKMRQPSQTRMRANIAMGASRNYLDEYSDPHSTRGLKTGKISKGAKFVKKRGKTVRKVMKYQSYPSSGEESDDNNELASGNSIDRVENTKVDNTLNTGSISVRNDKEVRFATGKDDDYNDNRSLHEISSSGKNKSGYNFGKYNEGEKRSAFSSLLSDSDSSVDLSDKDPPAARIILQRGPQLTISDGEDDNLYAKPNTKNSFKDSSLQRRNPLDMSLEALPASNDVNNEVLAFSILDVDSGDEGKESVPQISVGRTNASDTTYGLDDVEEMVVEVEPEKVVVPSKSKPVVWKSVAVRKSQEDVSSASMMAESSFASVLSSPVQVSIPKVSFSKLSLQPTTSTSDEESEKNVSPIEQSEKSVQQSTSVKEYLSSNSPPSNSSSIGFSEMTPATAKPPLPPTSSLSVSVDMQQQSMDSQLWMTRQPSLSPRLPPPNSNFEKQFIEETIVEEATFRLPPARTSSDRQNTIDKLKANILEKRRRSEATGNNPTTAHDSESPILDDANPTAEKLTSNQSLHNETATPGNQKPILPIISTSINSTNSFRSMRDNDNVNVNTSASDLYLQLLLPEHFQPPPLSDFAEACGVIVEGYLNKKSAVTGLWQKRYFVLAESSTHYCVMRIFGRAVETLWGHAPLNCKTSIPICDIERVDTVAAKSSKGREFTIKYNPQLKSVTSSSPTAASRPPSWRRGNSSPNGSVNSDETAAAGNVKVTTLQAEDPQTRLLWVTMLNRALSAYWVDLE